MKLKHTTVAYYHVKAHCKQASDEYEGNDIGVKSRNNQGQDKKYNKDCHKGPIGFPIHHAPAQDQFLIKPFYKILLRNPTYQTDFNMPVGHKIKIITTAI